MAVWLVGWLVGELFGLAWCGLVDWLTECVAVGWLLGLVIAWLVGWLIAKLTGLREQGKM